MKQRRYKVREVAALSGVSVRALHHYEQIGLLVPSDRSRAGYRLYSDADILRLQQIVVQRELGFALEHIRKLLDEPDFDRRAALRQQREQLLARVAHTQAMIRAIDEALRIEPVTDGGDEMTTDLKQIFDGFDPAQHEQEAEQRWGNTDAYKESKRRTSRYSKADWERYRAEQQQIMDDAVAALRGGLATDDPAVLAIAERHRLSIDRWFYPCSKSMHAGLADMYEADDRFAQNIDKHGPGLTPFLAAAIRANARNE